MPIPIKMRLKMSQDKFFCKCMLTNVSNKLVKIDWHHAFEYKTNNGWQINEKWAIAPLQELLHSPNGNDKALHRNQETKEYVQYLLLKRGDLKYIQEKYPKKDWYQLFEYLNNKYKNYKFNMFEKKEKKESKVKICKKCKMRTILMICECGNAVFKQDKK